MVPATSPTNYAWSLHVNSSWDKSLRLNENISLDLLTFFPVGLENNFFVRIGSLDQAVAFLILYQQYRIIEKNFIEITNDKRVHIELWMHIVRFY